MLATNVDLLTQQPISDLLPGAEVTVDGPIVRVSLTERAPSAGHCRCCSSARSSLPAEAAGNSPPDCPHGVGDVVLGHEHEVRRVTEGDERVPGRDACDRTVETALDEGGDDALTDTTLVASLVDDDDPADVDGVGQQVVDRQWHQPPKVEHPAADTFDVEAARRHEATCTHRCST